MNKQKQKQNPVPVPVPAYDDGVMIPCIIYAVSIAVRMDTTAEMASLEINCGKCSIVGKTKSPWECEEFIRLIQVLRMAFQLILVRCSCRDPMH